MGEADRREPPAHGADLGTMSCQEGQVGGDSRRISRDRVDTVDSAPSGSFLPVGAIAPNSVGRARGPGVDRLVLAQAFEIDERQGVVSRSYDLCTLALTIAHRGAYYS